MSFLTIQKEINEFESTEDTKTLKSHINIRKTKLFENIVSYILKQSIDFQVL